jgi:hypothetical protein
MVGWLTKGWGFFGMLIVSTALCRWSHIIMQAEANSALWTSGMRWLGPARALSLPHIPRTTQAELGWAPQKAAGASCLARITSKRLSSCYMPTAIRF